MKMKSKLPYILFLFVLLLFFCSDIDGIKKRKENKERTNIFFLYLAQIRTKGNCTRKETSTSIGTCDRRSAGNCNANDLILTDGEIKNNRSEGAELIKAVPTCASFYINAGFESDVATNFTNQDFILANNSYSVVTSCESLGLSATNLITETEFVFVNSSRGRIAIAADKILNTPDSVLSLTLPAGVSASKIKSDATTCLQGGFAQAEKDLVSDLRTSKRVKSITCSTKSGQPNQCPF